MIPGHQISKDLRDALGLPPMTRGFTLRCYSDEIVTVECEYYPEGSFQSELARYHLVRRTEQSPVKPFDFDAWMRDRTESAHREHMERTARLPAGRDQPLSSAQAVKT